MPNRTIYISDDNLPAWELLKARYGSVNSWLTTEGHTLKELVPAVSVSLGNGGVMQDKLLREDTKKVPKTRDEVLKQVHEIFPGAARIELPVKKVPVEDEPVAKKPTPMPMRYVPKSNWGA